MTATLSPVYAERRSLAEVGRPVHVMNVDGFCASIMRAPKIKDSPGRHAAELPPGQAVPVFPVDSFPAALDRWEGGRGKYLVPIAEDWALWWDFRGTLLGGSQHRHHGHVAVIPNCQGLNPITGRRVVQLDGFALEQYRDRCPVHDEPFAELRLCRACGYTWPAQNYLQGPENILWWDGFRVVNGDGAGEVRQFCFTREERKIVARQVLQEDVPQVFGFAFYVPVDPPAPAPTYLRPTPPWETPAGEWGTWPWPQVKAPTPIHVSDVDLPMQTAGLEYIYNVRCLAPSDDVLRSNIPRGSVRATSLGGGGKSSSLGSAAPLRLPTEREMLGVGMAGRIRQELHLDPREPSWWQAQPAAMIELHFVLEAEFDDIVAGGYTSPAGDLEGPYSGIPTT